MRPEATVAEVRRRLAAPPETVFAAFADAGLVGRWLTPAREIRLSVLAFDFREGGAYRFAYHVPGGQVMTVGGTYRVIEPPGKIVFSWVIEPPDEHAGLQSEVVVTLAAEGSGTALHIRHEKLTPRGAMARHAEGWAGALDQLAVLLASAPDRPTSDPPQGTPA
jgi:uncharacterized protein YndB with AHSA1/START domain